MKILTKKQRAAQEEEFSNIAKQLYSKNVELAHTNKTLAILRRIDTLVLDPDNSVSELAQAISDEIQHENSYPIVAIGTQGARNNDFLIRGISCNSETLADTDFTRYVGNHLQVSDEFIKGPQSKTIHIGNNSHKELEKYLGQGAQIAMSDLKKLGVDHILVHKLSSHSKLLGLLIVGLPATIADSAAESDFLARISEACGVAFDNKLLNAEVQRVARELKRSNDKLKALDQAKDEFVSMASHQLRTPLTSIKGYLSMILEGDAGEVPQQQKDMLNTAYVSAQRMVYLIADLLNVSRLQTGKFVIEPVDSYLPDVVSEELAQLKEAAQNKDIQIKYDKPSKFATIKLDETKIRQVIMNFVDNALYYTPMGGEVVVTLKESPKSIEFSVKDNGIGVPKAEQHKLFGKFFRAGNAQKARPDGTGLGLFMAKKVIVGSGGAIIFKSKEGKGSTFGFTFPKK